MTVNDLYQSGVSILKNADVDDAEFDSRCLVEFVLNFDTTHFLINRTQPVSKADEDAFHSLLKRRINGEPLQYILGKWEFMSNEFYVGSGVLVPRPETEILVELAVEYLKSKSNPVVIDLCSGTGCIAISLGKLIPSAKIYAVEKYSEAFDYLRRNIKLNSVNNVTAVQGDMFDVSLLKDVNCDLILSNPPYIKKADIDSLSPEVQNEPRTALDGGDDGYDYYRFLCDHWLSEFLAYDTAMMIECGEDQGEYIADLFSKYSKKQEIIRDFNNIQRIVIAYK